MGNAFVLGIVIVVAVVLVALYTGVIGGGAPSTPGTTPTPPPPAAKQWSMFANKDITPGKDMWAMGGSPAVDACKSKCLSVPGCMGFAWTSSGCWGKDSGNMVDCVVKNGCDEPWNIAWNEPFIGGNNIEGFDVASCTGCAKIALNPKYAHLTGPTRHIFDNFSKTI